MIRAALLAAFALGWGYLFAMVFLTWHDAIALRGCEEVCIATHMEVDP